jgi:hypothetical protein
MVYARVKTSPGRRQKRASNSSVAMHKYTVYKALAGRAVWPEMWQLLG